VGEVAWVSERDVMGPSARLNGDSPQIQGRRCERWAAPGRNDVDGRAPRKASRFDRGSSFLCRAVC